LKNNFIKFVNYVYERIKIFIKNFILKKDFYFI
jgi:hypothetical protein